MVHLEKLHVLTATRNHISGMMSKKGSKDTSETRPMLSRESSSILSDVGWVKRGPMSTEAVLHGDYMVQRPRHW